MADRQISNMSLNKETKSRELEEISSNERMTFNNMGIYILEPHDNAKNLKRRKTKKSMSRDEKQFNSINMSHSGLNPGDIEIRMSNQN
jgi:hypothetical protein